MALSYPRHAEDHVRLQAQGDSKRGQSGVCIAPLSDMSTVKELAERVGFEPTYGYPYNGFRVLRFLMLSRAAL